MSRHNKETVREIVYVPSCPRCKGSLSIACRGSNNGDGLLPMAVTCDLCGLEGPTCMIRYANRTEEAWDAFLSMYSIPISIPISNKEGG